MTGFLQTHIYTDIFADNDILFFMGCGNHSDKRQGLVLLRGFSNKRFGEDGKLHVAGGTFHSVSTQTTAFHQ